MTRRYAVALAAVLAGAALSWKRIRCWWYGHRDVRRAYLGFTCFDCGKRGGDLGAFRLMDGYVSKATARRW